MKDNEYDSDTDATEDDNEDDDDYDDDGHGVNVRQSRITSNVQVVVPAYVHAYSSALLVQPPIATAKACPYGDR